MMVFFATFRRFHRSCPLTRTRKVNPRHNFFAGRIHILQRGYIFFWLTEGTVVGQLFDRKEHKTFVHDCSSGDRCAAITFIIEEYMTVGLDRNGLGGFVLNGILKMEVKNSKHGFFKFRVESETPDIEFTTQNNIDIGPFSNDMILGLKSPNSPFRKKFRPLRWKLETKDVSLLPLASKCYLMWQVLEFRMIFMNVTFHFYSRVNCRTSLYENDLHVRVEYNVRKVSSIRGCHHFPSSNS